MTLTPTIQLRDFESCSGWHCGVQMVKDLNPAQTDNETGGFGFKVYNKPTICWAHLLSRVVRAIWISFQNPLGLIFNNKPDTSPSIRLTHPPGMRTNIAKQDPTSTTVSSYHVDRQVTADFNPLYYLPNISRNPLGSLKSSSALPYLLLWSLAAI